MANKLDTMKPVIVNLLEGDATLDIDAAGFKGRKRDLSGELVAYCWFGASEPEFNSEHYLTRDHTLYIELAGRDTTKVDDAIERLDAMIKDLDNSGGFFRTLFEDHGVIRTEHGRTVSALEDDAGGMVSGLFSCSLRVRYNTDI